MVITTLSREQYSKLSTIDKAVYDHSQRCIKAGHDAKAAHILREILDWVEVVVDGVEYITPPPGSELHNES